MDFKESSQVSLNIQEAKEKKVFVEEYKIDNLQIIDSNYIFPIQSVWEEKAWQLALDKNKKETYRILDSSSNNLIFLLNGKDTLITEKNFVNGKWIMKFDNTDNLCGSIRGMINFSLLGNTLNDTTPITIYRQKYPHDYNNNLTPIFKFDIIKN